MTATATAQRTYITMPFNPRPERAEVVGTLVQQLATFENIFSDYTKGCDSKCGSCEDCVNAKLRVTYMLSKPDTKSWEVWEIDGDTQLPLDLVGILYLTEISEGCDATAHYVFFDERLRDKTSLLEDVIEWLFTDHEDWVALKRLTVEIPTFAFALVRHAQRSLGFTGDFTFRMNGKKAQVEGVKRQAVRWRGEDVDVLVLGRINEEK